MPSFDSDPFSYLRARAMGEIASLNTGVGGPPTAIRLNGVVITLNNQPITKAA